MKHISSMTRPGNQPQKLAALKQAWQEWNNSPDVLIRLARRLATTLSLEDQLGVLAEEMADIVPFEAMMYRHTIARQEFVFRTGMGGPHRAEYRLNLEGELYGYLELHRRTRFSEEELEAIEVFIGAAICPIRNACRFIALEQMALTDTLTGVPNRRALDEDLGRICHLADRHNESHSLILVDLDHFKAVNDTHGHLIGDQVLRMSADGLTRTLRNSDRVYRFGGEEFAVLLPHTDAPHAREAAERIRLALASLALDRLVGAPLRITASCGVATHLAGEGPEQWLARADEALYRAKQAGRNQTRVFPAIG
ncbi:GGDEF domain-containing protein [Marinobacter lutaoensis]|uniref:diguanylate cyclase n=1 Tax=Marinobacter lutaoensis TaxID=135739 RepID=A0A1V2DUA1_9GAMM|nr:GGDEF domain-containing protein [Marinobacter lutaoensis]ONF44030.1 GGDEF domain-containing protein [Marinobacter lutaoensis]